MSNMDKLNVVLKYFLLLIIFDFINASKYTGKLLVVSFDGFRWDYTKFAETPNFDKLEELGTRVKYMNGVFPTKTFPSHYSIATGLHPESHGIVGNYMYDPDLKRHFSPGRSRDAHWWNQAEPIWITARKQGLVTAAYFWVGSAIEMHGIRPDFWLDFNNSIPFESRVDTVINWFTQDGVDFAMLYFNEPDSTAHRTGTPPKSRETIKAIEHCDVTLGYLLRQIESNHLSEELNLIVLSDHGMTNVLPDQLISISDYVTADDIYTVADEGTIANILPKRGKVHKVYKSLKGAHPNITVYLRENFPQQFHFNKHRRIHPILVVPDEGWLVVENASKWQSYGPYAGAHGYDNSLQSMKPFFRAMGPNIKPGFHSNIFNQTDVYPLMCELLGIRPQPNNGSLDTIGHMLRPSDMTSDCHATHNVTCHFYMLIALLFLLRTL